MAVLVDVSNLYHSIRGRFAGRLDYRLFLSSLQADFDVFRAIAYGAQHDNESESFIRALTLMGFECQFKTVKVFADGNAKANWDVEMAIDAFRILDSVDAIILGTADGDFTALVTFIQSRGKRCYVMGCNISRDLKEAANGFSEIGSAFIT